MRHKAKVLLVVMAYGNSECPGLGVWRALAAAWSATSPLIDNVIHIHLDVCPTPVARNLAVKLAREQGCDIIVSVDADTHPADGFFESSIEFLLKCGRPTVVLAPYVCGGGLQGGHGATERVQVFRWRTDRTGDANELARLDHYPREEASYKTGYEVVACGGTGCYACHTEAFDYIQPPYFHYQYSDQYETQVVATEDVVAFRDLAATGKVQVVCDWDHWVKAHWKTKAYTKPAVLHPDEVWGRTKELLHARDLHGPERTPQVEGWFDYAPLYDDIVRRCRPGGTIVEVGSFTGLSFVHLAKAAKARGAGVLCASVDHGLGGTEPRFAELVTKMGGTSATHLARRLLAEGLTRDVLQVVGTSAVAARQFADGSLDAVFLDADHDAAAVEADVRAWLPKLRPGGTLAGHDWDRPGVREGLKAAGVAAAQSGLSPSCWEWVKPPLPTLAPLSPESKNLTHISGPPAAAPAAALAAPHANGQAKAPAKRKRAGKAKVATP